MALERSGCAPATFLGGSEDQAARRAVAAGVNLILHPTLQDLHTARDMFPKDGRCKTFDATADGFERGEGAATLAFRHAQDACHHNDNIVAYVCGSACIHKGGGASLRAMRGPAIQQKVRFRFSFFTLRCSGSVLCTTLSERWGQTLQIKPEEILLSKTLIAFTLKN